MLHEYAIEPKSITKNWETFAYVFEKFGVHKARVISDFPENWDRKAIESCQIPDYSVDRKKVVERLRRAPLMEKDRSYDSQMSWLENAVVEHRTEEFKAIVSSNKHRDCSSVFRVDNVFGEHEVWKASRGKAIPKKATHIAETARNLIEMSDRVLLVDPHYHPNDERQYRRPIRKLLDVAAEEGITENVEIHLRARDEDIQVFYDHCQNHLEPDVPDDIQVHLHRWKEMPPDERMHPRYVLTEKGGIHYDYGLSEGDSGQTTDVNLLAPEVHEQRWEDYQPGTTPFQLVDDVLID